MMTHSRSLLAGLAAPAMAISVGCGPGQNDAASDAGIVTTSAASIRAEVAQSISGYLEVLTERDAQLAGGYYSDDARLLGPGYDLDRTGVLEFMKGFFDTGAEVELLDRRTLELFAHGDVAYELAQVEEVLKVPGVPPDTLRNNMFIRWEKGPDGNWRFDRIVIGPQAGS